MLVLLTDLICIINVVLVVLKCIMLQALCRFHHLLTQLFAETFGFLVVHRPIPFYFILFVFTYKLQLIHHLLDLFILY